jgi:tetratricopeptide (TPR) repeat protein
MRRLPALLVLALSLSACPEPDPAEAPRQAGNVLFKKGEFEKAGAEYEKAIALDKKPEAKAFETAAFAYMKGGNLGKASELLLKTLPFKQDNAGKLEVYRNITGMYLAAHRGMEAEQYFYEILKLEPKDPAAMGWLADFACERGGARSNTKAPVPAELDKALEWYAKVLEVTPDDIGVWVNRRIIYTRYADYWAGQKSAAEADAETNKKDKETAADFKQQAADAQVKIEEFQAKLVEANAKITELSKAKAAAAPKK